MTQSVIPISQLNLPKMCTICFEKIESSGKKIDCVTTLPCNHEFHSACIEQWKFGTCPNCRKAYHQSNLVVQSSESNVEPSRVRQTCSPRREFPLGLGCRCVIYIVFCSTFFIIGVLLLFTSLAPNLSYHCKVVHVPDCGEVNLCTRLNISKLKC